MVSIRSIVERMRNVPFGNITLEAAEKSFFVAKFLCFCHVANNYFFSIAQVYGPSMLPAVNLAGDLVLVERISHRIGHVGRGDIVVVRSPENPRKTITKRITGMEGDTVTYAVDPGQEDRLKTIVV
ncbi:Peptidase S26A [Cinnamomum micranthum f. kanehirae]|uniref:Peptidase S26A n=1 Tax=Cinnamomum micranthum f. kanehirae TaxID=337451 RepID=A0A443Q2Y6_9MAGN|nr:Peptidase S26A [Cinnamomum micranthum f. kanehirae]